MKTFSVSRPPFFEPGQLERIEQAAIRLLDEIGVRVGEDSLFQFLKARGFRSRDTRIFIEPAQARAFFEGERAGGQETASELDSAITLGVSNYPQQVHDLDSDEIVPFTTGRLIEATKLVDVLAARGVANSPPGNPIDAPPVLQPVLQYWIAAVHSCNGKYPVDPKSEESFPYVKAMSEVMGEPLRAMTVWVFTPLTLAGESLKCVLKYQRQLECVGVSNMASLGCTASIHPGDAYALAVAEVAGSAILLRERVGVPVRWAVGLMPIDMGSMAMIFGSPENFLLQLMTNEINAWFHGTPWFPSLRLGAGNVHSNAKLPGPQACAEKASLMTAGALLGARRFDSVGTLSLDEVFSVEQLLYDIEIKDHVQRLTEGMSGECDIERSLADVAEGIKDKGFASLFSTLSYHKDTYWRPLLFERDFLGAWRRNGAQTIRKRARGLIAELAVRHDYTLDAERGRELDKILEEARTRLM